MPEREKPSMSSVNIFMTAGAQKKMEDRGWTNRSGAVRHFAGVLIVAHDAGDERILPEIERLVSLTGAKHRREMVRSESAIWMKAIVWIPDDMMRSIERIFGPAGIRSSEFLRAAVIMGCCPPDIPNVTNT